LTPALGVLLLTLVDAQAHMVRTPRIGAHVARHQSAAAIRDSEY